MTTLYRKEQHGKRVRYVPCAESEAWGSWPAGHHLVSVQPGVRSIRHHVEPHHAAVLAAINDGREAMMAALLEATEAGPGRRLTPREQAAFARWKADTGQESLTLWRPAASDVFAAFETALQQRIKG